MGLFKKLAGLTNSVFRLGKDGVTLKSIASDLFQFRTTDDTGFARIQVAPGTADNDAVTKKQLETASKPIIVDGQADTSTAIPSNTGSTQILVVTTAGNGANVGDLLRDDGSGTGTMEILPAEEGRTLVITDALTGGSVAFDPDSMYIWDADGSAWIKIGDIGSVTGAIRAIDFAITTGASQDSDSQIPANAIIHSVKLIIQTPYSAGATIELGYTGNTSAILGSADNNPQEAHEYECEDYAVWDSSPQLVLATIGGSPVAGSGRVVVAYSVPNA